MQPLTRGLYTARMARTAGDLAASQALRHMGFRAARGLAPQSGTDRDKFDARCRHVLIHDTATATLVCSFRFRVFASGQDIGDSYAAQFYDLERLFAYQAPMLELGRFCLHPAAHDPDILRLAWAALTRIVDAAGVAMLFGCSSFDGADGNRHRPALQDLATRPAGPAEWQPGIASAEVIVLASLAPAALAVATRLAMPPLLRTYLAMGGWVSDHAVIDRNLDTLHVFTGLAIADIPAARARALRLIAG